MGSKMKSIKKAASNNNEKNVKRDNTKLIMGVLILVCIILIILVVVNKLEITKLQKQVSREGFDLASYKADLKEEVLAEIEASEKEQERIAEEMSKTKLSDKVKEDKSVEGIKITDIKVVTEEDRTMLEAMAINETENPTEEFKVRVTFLDESGLSRHESLVMMRDLEPGMSMPIRIDVPQGIGQISDIEFVKE